MFFGAQNLSVTFKKLHFRISKMGVNKKVLNQLYVLTKFWTFVSNILSLGKSIGELKRVNYSIVSKLSIIRQQADVNNWSLAD